MTSTLKCPPSPTLKNQTPEDWLKATTDYQVRKARIQDSAGILVCLHRAFERYRTEYTPLALFDTVLNFDPIERRLRAMCVLVAVSDEQIIGTISCAVNDLEGHLRGMAVSPEWQGTGVAAALLRAAENELRNNDCTFVTLDTTAPLKAAIRFYEKHRFSASGRVSDFFGMPLYEYRKTLSGSDRVG